MFFFIFIFVVCARDFHALIVSPLPTRRMVEIGNHNILDVIPLNRLLRFLQNDRELRIEVCANNKAIKFLAFFFSHAQQHNTLTPTHRRF